MMYTKYLYFINFSTTNYTFGELFSAYLFTESEMKLKEQLESECKRLEEAVNTVNLQKDEIEKMRCENRKCIDELDELKKINNDLQNKLDAVISQNGIYSILLIFLDSIPLLGFQDFVYSAFIYFFAFPTG